MAALYNIACCYSQLGDVETGLAAFAGALVGLWWLVCCVRGGGGIQGRRSTQLPAVKALTRGNAASVEIPAGDGAPDRSLYGWTTLVADGRVAALPPELSGGRGPGWRSEV